MYRRTTSGLRTKASGFRVQDKDVWVQLRFRVQVGLRVRIRVLEVRGPVTLNLRPEMHVYKDFLNRLDQHYGGYGGYTKT